MEHEFNVPNKEVNAILQDHVKLDCFYSYAEDMFKPHFTDNGYKEFTNQGFAMMYHPKIHEHNFQLTTTQIDVKQNEVTPTNYNLTVYMDIKKKW